jgi:hypothetical protein
MRFATASGAQSPSWRRGIAYIHRVPRFPALFKELAPTADRVVIQQQSVGDFSAALMVGDDRTHRAPVRSQQRLRRRFRRGDHRKRGRARNGDHCSGERPHGLLAFDRDWIKCASRAFRGASPGAGKPLRSCPTGSGLPCWSRPNRVSVGADYRPGCGRRPIRLAQGSAAAAVYLVLGLTFFFMPSRLSH